ncbi:MAG TPA: aromatase/cyclase [Amycolatopsis sp.]|uniref:aromatase/cyclase n=1 Tax=Amycolatopsis sp. TaxID=37632 RepID=UPI002B4954EF|nr:aromatase/cyclase [Amycolatopsis sp.]HKS47142.1 aromatase/cyclase [Amycolatopsis sp.]
MTPRQHTTRHSTVVDADVESVYRLIEDVSVWAAIFGPTVYVHPMARNGNRERLRIWASLNGKVTCWTSVRTLDRENRCISFEREHPKAPLARMGGHWEFRAASRGGTEIVLHHHFSTVNDSPESVDRVSRAQEENSTAELAALGKVTDKGHPVRDILFTFHHKTTASGSVADAYDFVHRAEHWPARLPHVAHVRLTEEGPRVQNLEMVTRAPGGQTQTTDSVRVCFANEMIAYKQRALPVPLIGHGGRWKFGQAGNNIVIESEHTVLLDPSQVRDVLGASATVGDARVFVRDAIERNSRLTLLHAKEFAERARTAPVPGYSAWA